MKGHVDIPEVEV